jgi:hypothetical protein
MDPELKKSRDARFSQKQLQMKDLLFRLNKTTAFEAIFRWFLKTTTLYPGEIRSHNPFSPRWQTDTIPLRMYIDHAARAILFVNKLSSKNYVCTYLHAYIMFICMYDTIYNMSPENSKPLSFNNVPWLNFARKLRRKLIREIGPRMMWYSTFPCNDVYGVTSEKQHESAILKAWDRFYKTLFRPILFLNKFSFSNFGQIFTRKRTYQYVHLSEYWG